MSIAVQPIQPIRIDHALDEPGLVRTLALANGPYGLWQRVFGDDAEQGAASGQKSEGDVLQLVPVFRGDWAYGDRVLVQGVEPIFHNEMFGECARKLHDGSIVRPELVYVNLTAPMPANDPGHCDTPNFRGLDKNETPYWLLHLMNHSGLFEAWRVKTATIVCWYYEGEGGEFWYWPDGPDRPPHVAEPRSNTGIAGDNDTMFHGVGAVGRAPQLGLPGLSIDSTLESDEQGNWLIANRDRVLVRYAYDAIRISVYWRAQVFRDSDEARIHDEHLDDLSVDRVIDLFIADLAERGVGIERPIEPLHDAPFIRALTKVYGRSPTCALPDQR